MKYVLGISLGYNASACIMDENQNVVYAGSEERFINVKNCKEFPLASIEHGIEYLNIDPKDIVVCNYSHYQDPDLYDLYRHTYRIDKKVPGRRTKLSKDAMIWHEEMFIRQQLLLLGIDPEAVVRINHHQAHAQCAYNLSPFHDKNDVVNLYVVMDGFGDGDSISMWIENKNALGTITLEKIYSEPMCKSVALVYQFVTGALGYKEHQHEGKITGLAAFGDPGVHFSDFKKLYNEFENIKHNPFVKSPIIDFDIFLEMKKRTYELVNSWTEGMTPEEKFEKSKDIAAGVQYFAESEAFEFVTKVIYEHGFEKVNLNLSGGLFANVKINQMLHEFIRQVQNVFVAPPMGDEGTCIGAACGEVLLDRSEHEMTNMTMRMGTSHGVDEIGDGFDDIIETLSQNGVGMFKMIRSIEEVSQMIAEDLSQNKIVCVFDGRMEFGPRALIGRSIMYNCRDKGANDWLNHQLGRTEYMPFAPFCKEEHATTLFEKVEGKEIALKNMTITVKGTEEFIENCPAACHIDNTARPQVISKDENEFAWMILDAFENITGDKALINTSFNLHNYPIIESTKIAIESWLTSNTHSLYIGGNGDWVKLSR